MTIRLDLVHVEYNLDPSGLSLLRDQVDLSPTPRWWKVQFLSKTSVNPGGLTSASCLLGHRAHPLFTEHTPALIFGLTCLASSPEDMNQ